MATFPVIRLGISTSDTLCKSHKSPSLELIRYASYLFNKNISLVKMVHKQWHNHTFCLILPPYSREVMMCITSAGILKTAVNNRTFLRFLRENWHNERVLEAIITGPKFWILKLHIMHHVWSVAVQRSSCLKFCLRTSIP